MNERLTIAFLDEDAYDEYHNLLAMGVADAARQAQVDVIRIGHFMVHFTAEEPEEIRRLQQFISQFKVDGLLLLGWARGAREHERGGLPSDLPVVTIGSSQTNTPGLVFQGNEYIQELTEHLIAVHGCRRIAFVDPFWPDNRGDAYREVMERHRLYDAQYHVSSDVLAGLDVSERGRQVVSWLLDRQTARPDAIMSLTNEETFEIIEALTERGLRVPEDIAVTSYEDGDIGRFSRVSLTTVDFPWYELGYLSTRKLIRRIKREDDQPLVEYVPGRVIYRDSCGCLPFSESLLLDASQDDASTSDGPFESGSVRPLSAALSQDTPFSRSMIDDLIAHYQTALEHDQSRTFLLYFERLLRDNEPRVITSGLRSFAIRFRQALLPAYLAGEMRDVWAKADDLCHQMQLILQNWLATARFRQDIAYRYQNTMVKEVGQILITNFEKESLYRSLNLNLPRVGVQSCQIFLFDNPSASDLFGRYHLSYSWSATAGQRYDRPGNINGSGTIGSLLMPEDRPAFLLAHFLHIGDHYSGFITISPEHFDIRQYRSLALRISSTLHEISLFDRLNGSYHQLMEQARRRGVEDTSAILHNIANLMNSVQLMAQSMQQQGEQSGLPDLKKANQRLRQTVDHLEQSILKNTGSQTLMHFYAALGSRIERFRTTMQEMLSRFDDKIRLIEEIVQSQTDLAEQSIHLEAVDIVQVLKDVLEMYQKTVQRESIELQYSCPPSVEVLAHRTRLFHVLTNVIKNAIESIQEARREHRRLAIRVVCEPDRVLVQIEDSGRGIQPNQLDQIFGYGYSTKQSGHGFGLHSCANYMTEMKGRIWAENAADGRGAVFNLRFRPPPVE